MLLPGTFQAKIEKRDVKVCEPKDNGNCREVKFLVLQAVPTVAARGAEPGPETAGPAPPTTVAIQSPETPATASPPAAAPASLAIVSVPPDADIEIDGNFVGNTPSTVNVAAGSHMIAVKKKGFADWKRTLNVTGGNIHLSADLDSATPAAPPAPATAPATATAPTPQ